MNNDLISREAALDLFRNTMNSYRIVGMRSGKALLQRTVNEALEGLNKLPAVDAAPVMHGRWIDSKGAIRCSECLNTPLYDYHGRLKLSVACPNCGAKMDAGDDTNAQHD